MRKTFNSPLFVLFNLILLTFVLYSCKAEVSEATPEPEPVYYTVTYVSENGTAPQAISVLENTVLTEEQLPSLSSGTLVFKGWYVGNVKVIAGEYHVTENVTLTAHWASTATVSYHSIFGDVPESFDVEVDQTLTATNLENITCSPYTFQGWFYSKDEGNNGTGIQAQADDPITTDTPLYAKWQTATVTFSTQFGTAPSVTKYTGTKIESSEIKTLSNTGYAFGGWFNGSTQLTTNYTVMSNVTFTARWTANTYTITFKANGGAGADYTQTVTYGTTTKLNANAFSYPGYDFLQWNIAADGSGTSYSDEADFVVQANDMTLHAQWDPIADNTTIIDMIKASTETRTIAAKGEFSNTLMAELKQVLNEKNYHVTLDFSHVTGLTSLEKYAFEYCWIDEIILPETITAIPSWAFNNCYLKKIRIPESVTSIGSYAFCDCSYLTSITIPDSVTSIGPIAFQDCENLKSIIIPDSITTIPNQAFFGCKNLESVTIPNSVTTIGKYAFENCEKLRSITIPESVVFFGNDCFEKSPITQMVFADTESNWYSTINGNTYIGKMNNPSKNGTLIKEYTDGYSVFSEKYSQ